MPRKQHYVMGKPATKQEHDEHMKLYGDMDFMEYLQFSSNFAKNQKQDVDQDDDDDDNYSGYLSATEFNTLKKQNGGKIKTSELMKLREKD